MSILTCPAFSWLDLPLWLICRAQVMPAGPQPYSCIILTGRWLKRESAARQPSLFCRRRVEAFASNKIVLGIVSGYVTRVLGVPLDLPPHHLSPLLKPQQRPEAEGLGLVVFLPRGKASLSRGH